MHKLYMSVIVLLLTSASSGFAAQVGTRGGGQGFSCPPGDELCTCDGTYSDCNNMKVNCVGGKITCQREGDIERCWCERINSAIRRPGTIRVPNAPVTKQ
jgi:hypothetical protein